ncbi:MAG: ribonuclease J [Patescibacteria group bacterium]|nr:ribonuclease J [Patescibacteria group bacterium]
MANPIVLEKIKREARSKSKKEIIKEPIDGVLRIIPLGGLEEVGRNLTALEWRQKNGQSEIIIIDVGIGFPESEIMPGIDFIIPNTEYLEKNKENILAILITHGHYDHIGALPYLLEKIGNPIIYTAPLTKGLILKRQADFPEAVKPAIEEIKKTGYRPIRLGHFTIEYFHVNHSIPDSLGFFIKTPVGNIMHTGDFKIDFTPVFDQPADLGRVVQLAEEGVKVLMMDSTNANNPGHLVSERKIMENLELIFQKAKGRVIAATFASLLERIQQLIYLSGVYGRKVVIEGHSMKINTEVAKRLNYLSYPKGIFIRPEESLKMPPHQVSIFCTGSQAEDGSVLSKIADREHRYFRIIPNDTVVFSSSIIPGNENVVQDLKDVLVRQGAKIIHYQMMDIHASGHAFADDIRLFTSLVKPEYLMPVHGYFHMQKAVEEIGVELGLPRENIIIAQNGSVVEVKSNKVVLSQERQPANLVYVDGLGVGDIGEVVLRDRQTLAQDGIFVVIVTVDSQTGDTRTSPDIISRGFVYLKESKELLRETRDLIKRVIEKNVRFLGEESPIIQDEQIKYRLKEEVAEFLFKRTKRRPMVLPVVIKI